MTVDRPARAQLAQLVNAKAISERVGVGRPAVSNWEARYPDYPAPLLEVGGAVLWWWPDVEAWLRATGR